jgi:hypothetical protein
MTSGYESDEPASGEEMYAYLSDEAAMGEEMSALDVHGRVGRGQRSESHQQFMLERAMALIEDIPADELSEALTDDSGDSVTDTSGGTDTVSSGDESADADPSSPGPMSVHDLSDAEDDQTMACYDAKGASGSSVSTDGTYGTETEQLSEEITSDADVYEVDIEEFFELEHWTPEDIENWRAENSAAASAMDRSKLTTVLTVPEGMDARSGDKPSELCMIDAGTFRHMAGTGIMHLATNIRKIKPHPVLAADGGRMYLDTQCDLILQGCQFTGCLVNPHIRTTLLSEGWMFMAEGWKIENGNSGKCLRAPSGMEELAHRRGMIFYLPAIFLPSLEENKLLKTKHQWWLESHDGDLAFDQEMAMGLCDEDLAMMVAMATQKKGRQAVEDDEHARRCKLREAAVRLADACCVCPTRCEGKWSDTCHGSHGFSCVRNYRKAEKMIAELEARYGWSAQDDTSLAAAGEDAAAAEGPESQRASDSGTQVTEHPLIGLCQQMCPDATADEIQGLKDAITTGEKATRGSDQQKALTEHVKRGHRTSLPEGQQCADCVFAKMLDKPAFKGSTRAPHNMITCCVDTNDMVEESVNGNRYYTVAVLFGSKLSQVEAGPSKDSIATAKRWRKMKHWFEVVSDPGGTEKIQVLIRDPGTEFEGAMRTEREIDNIKDQVGETNRHTHAGSAENLNRMLPRTAVAMCSSALRGDHDQYEELSADIWCEAIKAANILTNHHPVTENQRKLGISPIEEQSGGRIVSEEYLKGLPAFGTLVYGFTPKRLREGKLSARSFKAIFLSRDEYTEGTFRVMPFESRDGKWVLHKTVRVGKFLTADNVFPLRANPENEASSQRCDEAWEKIFSKREEAQDTVFVTPDTLLEDGGDAADSDSESTLKETFDVEDVVGRITDPDDGAVQYELTWQRCAPEDTTWHYKEDLTGCERLIREFEARVEAQGDADELEVYAPRYEPGEVMAAQEIDLKEFTAQPSGREAIIKEWNAMTTPAFGCDRARLIEMTEDEAANYKDSKGKPSKTLLKLRYACTQKRATPEQLDVDPNAKGIMKARLVAQDLKFLNPADPAETYAPVPEACVFRLMIAAHHIREHDISASDVRTAYLQGDPFPYNEAEPKDAQWIACKVLDPLTMQWRYMWMTGEIYGRQPAGKNWHETLTRKHNEMGFEEGRNAKSIYFNAERTVKTAVHVDDPVNFAKRPSHQPYPSDSELKLQYYEDLAKHLEIRDMETLSRLQNLDYLSLRLSVSADDEVCISNADFILKLIEKHGLIGCNPAVHPISRDLLKIVQAEADAGLFMDATGIREYQGDVGALNWLATTLCPKLAVAVSLLAKRSAKPTISCTRMIKHAIRWLAGNVDMCLKTDYNNRSGLVLYSDSDHAGNHSIDGERRSRKGILATYNGMPIAWESSWIKAICTSSAEAEVYAMADAVKLAQHLKWICQELHIPVSDCVPVYVDASAALSFAGNLGGPSQSRLKHIDLRLGIMEQLRYHKEIDLIKIDGKINPANFFSKILTGIEFKRESEALMWRVELSKALWDQLRIRGHGERISGDDSAVGVNNTTVEPEETKV